MAGCSAVLGERDGALFACDFVGALRRFARVLRIAPLDLAARWYLLRCEALRGGVSQPDTGLLYD